MFDVFVKKLQDFALLSPDMLLPLLVTTRCFVILSSLCPLSLSQWNLRLCDRDEDNFKICVILTPWCAVPVCFSQYCCCLSYFAVKSLESGGSLCIMFVVGGIFDIENRVVCQLTRFLRNSKIRSFLFGLGYWEAIWKYSLRRTEHFCFWWAVCMFCCTAIQWNLSDFSFRLHRPHKTLNFVDRSFDDFQSCGNA